MVCETTLVTSLPVLKHSINVMAVFRDAMAGTPWMPATAPG